MIKLKSNSELVATAGHGVATHVSLANRQDYVCKDKLIKQAVTKCMDGLSGQKGYFTTPGALTENSLKQIGFS